VPSRDIFHNAVKNALLKDGWTITDDPLFIQFGGIDLYVDLGAEKIIAAEKGEQKIAIEIKSFIGPSLIADFHTALGQFMNYRLALEKQNSERILYLAVPSDAYNTFFNLQFTQEVVQRYGVKLIIYEVETEVIIQWQN
jgi:hypothetical protein